MGLSETVIEHVLWTPGKNVKSLGTEMRLGLCIPGIEDAALHRARPNKPWLMMTILIHQAEIQTDVVTLLSPRMRKRGLPAPWGDTDAQGYLAFLGSRPPASAECQESTALCTRPLCPRPQSPGWSS